MGMLVDGKWTTEMPDARKTGGRFVRADAAFRNWVTADGSSGFKAEAGRYHLYVSHACPWAHRTMIYRALKGLKDAISVTVVEPLMLEHGWEIADGNDPVNGAACIASGLCEGEARLYRPMQRAGAVGQGKADDRQQREFRDNPHVQFRVRRDRRRGP